MQRSTLPNVNPQELALAYLHRYGLTADQLKKREWFNSESHTYALVALMLRRDDTLENTLNSLEGLTEEQLGMVIQVTSFNLCYATYYLVAEGKFTPEEVIEKVAKLADDQAYAITDGLSYDETIALQNKAQLDAVLFLRSHGLSSKDFQNRPWFNTWQQASVMISLVLYRGFSVKEALSWMDKLDASDFNIEYPVALINIIPGPKHQPINDLIFANVMLLEKVNRAREIALNRTEKLSVQQQIDALRQLQDELAHYPSKSFDPSLSLANAALSLYIVPFEEAKRDVSTYLDWLTTLPAAVARRKLYDDVIQKPILIYHPKPQFVYDRTSLRNIAPITCDDYYVPPLDHQFAVLPEYLPFKYYTAYPTYLSSKKALAVAFLQSRGVTPKHFEGKDWFSSYFHPLALVTMMENDPTLLPEDALNQLEELRDLQLGPLMHQLPVERVRQIKTKQERDEAIAQFGKEHPHLGGFSVDHGRALEGLVQMVRTPPQQALEMVRKLMRAQANAVADGVPYDDAYALQDPVQLHILDGLGHYAITSKSLLDRPWLNTLQQSSLLRGLIIEREFSVQEAFNWMDKLHDNNFTIQHSLALLKVIPGPRGEDVPIDQAIYAETIEHYLLSTEPFSSAFETHTTPIAASETPSPAVTPAALQTSAANRMSSLPFVVVPPNILTGLQRLSHQTASYFWRSIQAWASTEQKQLTDGHSGIPSSAAASSALVSTDSYLIQYTQSTDERTQCPVYDVEAINEAKQRVGSITVFGMLGLCRSEDGSQHNVVGKPTGIFANVQNDPRIVDTCQVLPPQFVQDLKQTISQAGIRGATNVVNHAMQTSGYSPLKATIVSETLNTATYFMLRWHYHSNEVNCARNPENSFYNSAWQALMDTGYRFAFQVATPVIGNSLSAWLYNRNFTTTAAMVKEASDMVPYSLYLADAHHQTPEQAMISLAAGTATEFTIRAAGTAAVNLVANRQKQLSTNTATLFSNNQPQSLSAQPARRLEHRH